MPTGNTWRNVDKIIRLQGGSGVGEVLLARSDQGETLGALETHLRDVCGAHATRGTIRGWLAELRAARAAAAEGSDVATSVGGAPPGEEPYPHLTHTDPDPLTRAEPLPTPSAEAAAS